MIRLWLQGLARKILRGRTLRRTSGPAPKVRARPRFDTLEDRTVASATYFEPPVLDAPVLHAPPTGPSLSVPVGETPTAEIPAAKTPVESTPDYWDGASGTNPYDPGQDKFLDDAVHVPIPPSDPSDFTLADDVGQPSDSATPHAGGARSENLTPDRATRRDELHAADPASPRRIERVPAPPGVRRDARMPVHNAGGGAAVVSKVEYFTRDRLPPNAVGQDAGARSGEDFLDRAGAVAEQAAVKRHAAGVDTSNLTPQPSHAAGELPDGSLLQRYAANREETAFAALVQRHEQLVFGVCRRVLGDSHAALDAFQATFLVLARRASMLDKSGSLAGWLYKVAYHLALRLREVASRQRRREQEAARERSSVTASADLGALEKQEIREALSEELDRLPEKYRVPLVLCYFDGRTHEEAARAIGLPRGSMAKRIGEGLERLRERLSDRGLAP